MSERRQNAGRRRKPTEAKAAAEAKQKAEAAKQAEAQKAAEAPAPGGPDDLTRLEGIGPKISGLLQATGITTFAQLADTDVDRIKQILEEADPKLLRLADPSTWPRQARLAASGKWEALERWQERLKRGKESSE
jgi:predicted flap endonuclease-1-like 5' DNA nuclease